MSEKSLRLLYEAFIKSNLLYCSNIVAFSSKINLKKYFIMQMCAIQYVNIKQTHSTTKYTSCTIGIVCSTVVCSMQY